MTQTGTPVWDEAVSDAELITAVRTGDNGAFAMLYERHAGAARTVAYQYVPSGQDADDVVSDAFAKVFAILQGGGGPDVSFRAYLFTVVRRLSYDLVNGARRTAPTDDVETFETAIGPLASTEDPALADFERSVVARAYQTLPERWQAVLWYTEVEGLGPADVAPILGLTANGVAALAYRAREGLRQAYLQQHLKGAVSEECEQANPLLGSYVRGGLAKRETARVESHLEDCGDCRALVLELGDVSHGMRTVVAPLVLGLGAIGLVGTALPVAGGVAAAGATGGAAVGAGASGSSGSGSGSGAAGTSGTAGGGTGTGGATAGASGAGGAGGGGAAGATAATGTAAGGAGAATAGATGLGALIASSPAIAAAAVIGVSAVAGLGLAAVLGVFSADDGQPQAAPTSAATAEPLDPQDPAQGDLVDEPEQPGDEPPAEDPPADAPPVDADPLVQDATSPVSIPALPVPPVDDVVDAVDDPPPAEPPAPAPEPETPAPPAPAALGVSMPDLALVAREAKPLVVTASNSGGSPADDVHVDLVLPPNVTTVTATTGGRSISPELTAAEISCGDARPARDGTSVVTCAVGTLDAGAVRDVAVTVRASRGGEYAFGAAIWGRGIEPVHQTFPAPPVPHFGAEVRIGVPVVERLTNPGSTTVTLVARNTGDRTARDVAFTVADLPAGLEVSSATRGWACEPQTRTSTTCTSRDGASLPAPRGTATSGEPVEVTLRLLADGSTTAGSARGTFAVTATDQDTPVGARQAAAVGVEEPWAGAARGGVAVQAQCVPGRAGDRFPEVEAALLGGYTNTTRYDQVRVTLHAPEADTTSEPGTVGAGQAVRLRAYDGLRLPAGTAEYVLTTTVAGRDFSHTVSAGRHGAHDCYEPVWPGARDASVTVVNEGGALRIVGTLANPTDEHLDARLLGPDGLASPVHGDGAHRLRAGTEHTFTIDTGRTELARGEVTFRQYRWVEDIDGDGKGYQNLLPLAFEPATLAPAVGAVSVAPSTCTYDPATGESRTDVSVTYDNRASTLPVEFSVAGHESSTTRTVAGGPRGSERVTLSQVATWEGASVEVRADGRRIATTRVAGHSCYVPQWSRDVAVTVETPFEGAVVVGTFRNTTSAPLTVRMAAGGHGETRAQQVAPSATATFRVATGEIVLPAGAVTFTQSRTADGEERIETVTARHQGADATVRDVRVTLQEGTAQYDTTRHESYRPVSIVVDNSRSNVPADVVVSGDHRASAHVPRGGSHTFTIDRVPEQGARYVVSDGHESTTVEVAAFSAAPDCHAPWNRLRWYDHSASASFEGWNYDARNSGIGTPPTGSALSFLFWERTTRCQVR